MPKGEPGEEFEIYFSDLNPTAQAELLEFVGVSDPADMNWDGDILPLATFPFPEDEEGED